MSFERHGLYCMLQKVERQCFELEDKREEPCELEKITTLETLEVEEEEEEEAAWPTCSITP